MSVAIRTVADWDGREVTIANSQEDESGTWITLDYRDNLMRGAVEPWPPAPVVQELSRSDHGRFKDEELRTLATRELGFYSDLHRPGGS